MKKAFFISLLIFSGCVKYIPYHSTAHNQRYTVEVATSMYLIPEDRDHPHDPFAVVAAIDDSARRPSYYVILAPVISGPSTLNDVELGHHATILPSDAKEIISHLDDMVKDWDLPTADTAANFYEFTTHTEMPIPSNSTFVATRNMVVESEGPLEDGWVPSFNLTYNRTNRGSIMTIQIGTPRFAYRYEFKKKEEAIGFQIQMQNALKLLTSKGMI